MCYLDVYTRDDLSNMHYNGNETEIVLCDKLGGPV